MPTRSRWRRCTADLLQVRVDERAETLRLLSNRRDELVGLRTQAVCRLHRELQILIPGGASRALTAVKAKTLLASVRPRDEVGKVRKALALDQLRTWSRSTSGSRTSAPRSRQSSPRLKPVSPTSAASDRSSRRS